jgi:hypothetical protein
MLLFYPKDWFDVNKIGVAILGVSGLIVPFLTMPWWLMLIVELLLLYYLYYLLKQIKQYQKAIIIVNNENQWALEQNKQRFDVEVKDYWFLTGYLFLWLKGSNKSVSIVLSRRIIGAVNFSQIRTKIL